MLPSTRLGLPNYAAAQPAADRIHRHLATHAVQGAFPVAALPDAATLAVLIDAAFWTSLRREEGYVPRISLAFVAPERVGNAVLFANPIPLEPKDLTKVAAAVERAGLHLGVWPAQDGEIRVWGISRSLPPYCLVLEVILPGLLVVKRSPAEESGKFINIAVLQGDEIKIIDPVVTIGPQSNLLSSLLRIDAEFPAGPAVNVLLELAVSMRAHGRGGSLLVVPAASEAWSESILQPIIYSVTPAFSRLADLMEKYPGGPQEPGGHSSLRWEEALARAIDGIAGLTAVDGATLITVDYRLLAFGAKIVRRKGSEIVGQVIATEPVEGGTPVMAEPSQFGGTRHLSAAQFVHDQRDATALVASQDGRFTVFAWSAAHETVHAHRIDALLL